MDLRVVKYATVGPGSQIFWAIHRSDAPGSGAFWPLTRVQAKGAVGSGSGTGWEGVNGWDQAIGSRSNDRASDRGGPTLRDVDMEYPREQWAKLRRTGRGWGRQREPLQRYLVPPSNFTQAARRLDTDGADAAEHGAGEARNQGQEQGREEVSRHEKTDGLPGREIGRQQAVDDLFEEQVYEHRAEPPDDRGEEHVEARLEQ